MVLKWVIASVAAATVCAASQVLVAPLAHAGPVYLQPCSDKDKPQSTPLLARN